MKNSLILSNRARPAAVVATPRTAVTTWLYTLAALVALMVVVGGYVRLSRSGLSIVEWNAVTGVVPPLSEEAWRAEFAKYQQSPEYQKVNLGMSLDEYKSIFLVEYFHRLIARLVGLIMAAPLAFFLWRGVIPLRQSGLYLGIAALFLLQAFMGWFMVASGLVDRPSVSHYRLTIHLLLALLLMSVCLWAALDRSDGAKRASSSGRGRHRTLGLTLLVALVVQIAYGGLTAGLKAGHASNTWPLMFGQWLPPGLLASIEPWWRNLLDTPATVQYVHRWFAFVVLLIAALLYWHVRGAPALRGVQGGAALLVAIVLTQMTLGVTVVLFNVTLPLALLHQATAVALLATAVFINHRLYRAPA